MRRAWLRERAGGDRRARRVRRLRGRRAAPAPGRDPARGRVLVRGGGRRRDRGRADAQAHRRARRSSPRSRATTTGAGRPSSSPARGVELHAGAARRASSAAASSTSPPTASARSPCSASGSSRTATTRCRGSGSTRSTASTSPAATPRRCGPRAAPGSSSPRRAPTGRSSSPACRLDVLVHSGTDTGEADPTPRSSIPPPRYVVTTLGGDGGRWDGEDGSGTWAVGSRCRGRASTPTARATRSPPGSRPGWRRGCRCRGGRAGRALRRGEHDGPRALRGPARPARLVVLVVEQVAERVEPARDLGGEVVLGLDQAAQRGGGQRPALAERPRRRRAAPAGR